VTQLIPVQLDDGMMLYIEAQNDTETSPSTPAIAEPEEQRRNGHKGLPSFNAPRVNPAQSMQLMQNTIRTYAYYCMNAFKNSGVANIDEVTLEFGVNISADAGVPYIASGKAQSSLKITVKCSYPKAEAISAHGLAAAPETGRG
jgi:hypothetical protein